MNKVTILIPGYADWNAPGKQRASGTITLIQGVNKNIVVDTGVPKQKKQLVRKLKECGLNTNGIDFVVNTHGQSDHVGNNNLFPRATFLLDVDVAEDGDQYSVHDYSKDAFHLDNGISVIATPGHTDHDLSVVVENTELGTIVVAGDTFEREGDFKDWEAWSKDKERQRRSREKIMHIADHIVPGHGEMFPAPSLLDVQLGPAQHRNGGGEKFLRAEPATRAIAELARRFRTHFSRVDEVRIGQWLLQFGSYLDAQSILPLLQRVYYVDDGRLREMFWQSYNEFRAEHKRKIAFCVLGGSTDSSSLVNYLCSKVFDETERQGLPFNTLPQLCNAYAPDAVSVVFLDDCIAEGRQAIRMFQEWLGVSPASPRHVKPLTREGIEWLKAADLTYLAIVGLRRGTQAIIDALEQQGLKIRIQACKTFDDSDKCFSASSAIYDNPQVRLHARKLAAEIGYHLYMDRTDWDDERRKAKALGHEQLIVFSYNTPNCTLPILWKKGMYNGKPWEPLFPRME